MPQPESADFAAWLKRQRWFGGKEAEIARVRVVDEASLGGLSLLALEVSYREGRPAELYLLPQRPGSEEALDEESGRAILEVLRRGLCLRTRAGRLRGERLDGPESALDALPERPAVRQLSSEQSNTSLVFGEAVILKLIRKLQRGKNPELEMGEVLARRGFRGAPALLGALSLEGEVEATAGVAHRFLQVDADGWSYVLEAFTRDPAPGAALLGEIRELGARVGELHMALADPDDPAFAPEPLRASDLRRWTESLLGDLEETLRLAAAKVPGLSARAGRLRERIRRLATAAPGGVRLRQHGDLHLGQVLRCSGRWLIFDFEGEPARTLAERREKHSPCKDIAGMLRSFSYAAAAAERRGAVPGDRAGPAGKAFLEGYRSTARALLPEDEEAGRILLDSLVLEKLLYELRYEVGHRPDWVEIPARDLLREEA